MEYELLAATECCFVVTEWIQSFISRMLQENYAPPVIFKGGLNGSCTCPVCDQVWYCTYSI